MGPRIDWLRGSGGTLETVFPALTRRSDLRRSGRQPRSGVRLTDAWRRAGNAAAARPPGCLARTVAAGEIGQDFFDPVQGGGDPGEGDRIGGGEGAFPLRAGVPVEQP